MRAIELGLVLSLALLVAPLVPAAPGAAASPALEGQALGLFDPYAGLWYLRDAAGHTTRLGPFGRPGDVPLVGDWDGDGVDTLGVYRPEEGRLILRASGLPIAFVYPMPGGGLPVVADTDGDGRDTVSLARGGRLYVLDGLGRGPEESTGPDPLPLPLPPGTEALVGGDFDGDGVDEVAAVHQGRVEVIAPHGGFGLGYVGTALPVAGDWNGDGVAGVGVYDPWRAAFRLVEREGTDAPRAVPYGSLGMLPVAGAFGALPGKDTPPPHRAGLPAMAMGEVGPEVALLQQELSRRHLYRGAIDGEFGPAAAYAVLTFHKVLGVERTWEWEEEDSRRMAAFILPPLPERPEEPDRVEVDVGRQVLYLIEDHEVAAVVPVSTAGGYLYYSVRSGGRVRARTPHGDFTLTRHSRGWSCDSLTGWCIYNPWNFTPMYALHGYGEVPAYPASHGCVRLPIWESDLLEAHLLIGMPFHVWDEYRPRTR
ncbi:MAG: murein L,D-transpeptidase [Acidimicrobiia bacterium]|nr:murein L,D-transpeptidase [Acidimicrobiia bacterium]